MAEEIQLRHYLLLTLMVFLLGGCSNLKPTAVTSLPISSPTPTTTATPTLQPIPTPIPNLGSIPTPGNGSTWTRPADGMAMVNVPEGEFTMGAPDGTGDSDEHPQHKVYLDAFWIDQTDVTNAMYALCMKAGACQPPSNTKSLSGSSYFGNPLFNHYPVVYVNWNQANTYCQWAGAHLPSEAQWEKAARGTDGRIYPWGNSWPTCPLANLHGCTSYTTKVDVHSPGASPYGVLDMAGNVWQWVSDWYDPGYYAISPLENPIGPSSGQYHVQRGASYNSDENDIRSFTRAGDKQPDGGANVGFRCAHLSP